MFRRLNRAILFGLSIVLFACSIAVYLQTRTSSADLIESLLRRGERRLSKLLSRQATTLEAARANYKDRRGLEPPKGFDEWFALATRTKVVIVEDFWDPIYDDLSQYASLSPSSLRRYSEIISRSSFPRVRGFFIKDGNVSSTCQPDNTPCQQLEDMLRRVAKWLPDMSIPVNGHASPRVVVPYPHSSTAVGSSVSVESSLRDTTAIDADDIFAVPGDLEAIWHQACSPNSPMGQLARNRTSQSTPVLLGGSIGASLVSNIESARDVCEQPWLQKMHGALVRPLALEVSREPVPLFAPARIAGVETAMLYPDAIYWAQDPGYYVSEDATAETLWHEKENKAFWRGSNTGGGHGPTNWQYFHRHRFVALTNASYLESVRQGKQKDWTGTSPYSSDTISFLAKYADTGFSAIACRDDLFRSVNQPCSYLDAHFHPTSWLPLEEAVSSYRYLFDVDGNSFSGRFHSLLLSNSVVLKVTIYREWHDSRLVPWLHYVPISNHFGHDLWEVLRFFSVNEDKASRIARSARLWALRVLRPEDMEIYLLRLLLEWARLIVA